jgi:hypothetical protein
MRNRRSLDDVDGTPSDGTVDEDDRREDPSDDDDDNGPSSGTNDPACPS